MTLCLKVPKEQGEPVIAKLKEQGILDLGKKIDSDDKSIYIPIKRETTLGEVVEREAPARETKHRSISEILKNKLNPEELETARTSFDLIGNVAVLEIPAELEPKEKLIGEALLELYPQLTSVLKKTSAVVGEYRVREHKKIAGAGSTITTYKEHGCTYKFDVAKVFFTPRLSTERLLVAKQVKQNEVIVDMFAGVGPFSILIAKKQPLVKKIYAIDINPDAVSALKENTVLNKVQDKIEAIGGDATKVVDERFDSIADRVVMNLPKTEKDFLPWAVRALKKQGTIHFYTFASTEEDVRKELEGKLSGHDFEILEIRRVRPYAPYEWNFAADIYLRKT
jgi:tRNA (guanine37-N1)-methyltransferase